MANSIIVQTAQEARIHRKREGGYLLRLRAAVPMRLLVEVHGEHVAFGYGVQIGERYCMQALRSRQVGALMRYVSVMRSILGGLAFATPTLVWLLLFGGS